LHHFEKLVLRWARYEKSWQQACQVSLIHLPAFGDARGVVQISHGAAEHSRRYLQMAEILSAAGFHVFAHDHRGHGETIVPGWAPHTFGPGGWDSVIEDVEHLHRYMDDMYSGLPRIVLGHSMGAVISLEHALRYPERPDALILLGPVTQKEPAMPILRMLLSLESVFRKPGSVSPSFKAMAWDVMNKDFRGGETDFDWLSRDPVEVQAYADDPDCGWSPTVHFAQEFAKGLQATYSDARLSTLNTDMPVLLMAGGRDPSSGYGKSVRELEQRLKTAGLSHITATVFEDMRHELHNETGRDAVFDRLLNWCRKVS
ncbi:MAG: lysophospholipase, partial [Pseudomonadota bacterium]